MNTNFKSLNPNAKEFTSLGIYTKAIHFTERVTANLKQISKIGQHSIGEKIYNGLCDFIVLFNRAYREDRNIKKYEYALKMRDAFCDLKTLLKFCSDIKENIQYEKYVLCIGDIERQMNGWINSLENKINKEAENNI